MTDLKHFMNAQARAHLAHLKMHYGNNLHDQPCVLHVAFCTCASAILMLSQQWGTALHVSPKSL